MSGYQRCLADCISGLRSAHVARRRERTGYCVKLITCSKEGLHKPPHDMLGIVVKP